MEKKVGEITYLFKNELKMFEWQMINKTHKGYEKEKIDEMQFAFELFSIFCASIDGKILSQGEYLEHIKNISDYGVFNEINEIITDLAGKLTDGLDEKKK